MRELSHFGIPVAEKMEGMAYLEDLKVHITDHAQSPNKLEFLYFESDSPMHSLIQSRAHIAYNVRISTLRWRAQRCCYQHLTAVI